ncbi:MAG: hypothetical protein IJL02_03690 [Methanobrevibacter sp.]|uniref:hypothetical protein n=1 Tax=Methanobrevibacter sp. TaxID=66852 RepID=UPI0025E91FF6|nr:hypothetical protein [Methanobrevibacter sp.]MBQ6098946.1 hypothetical protein [Methanobrevibacter sp.]
MNSFGIIGIYTISMPVQTMFLNERLEFTNKNIITQFGESFFLNRWINDAFDPLEYIAVGNGNNQPQKTDLTLGNETSRRKCNCEADLKNKCLILTTAFKASEMLGTSEIGVFNDKIMISHDRYEKIDDTFLSGAIGEVTVEYKFQLSTGSIRRGWQESQQGNNIFYISEKNNVVGVFENNTGSGYRRVNTLQDLHTIKGGYYYDSESQNLYIRPTKDTAYIRDINEEEIVVQVN